MGLFQQITEAITGEGAQHLQRMASGQANVADPNSPDSQQAHDLLSSAPQEHVAQAISQAAGQSDPQEYQQHLSSTNPFSSLGSGSLGTIASALLSRLGGTSAGSGGMLSHLIPGLHTTDPNQMDASQVASLASYARQNHPEAFAQAASDVGKQEPGLLHFLLGHKMLTAAVAALAMKYLRH